MDPTASGSASAVLDHDALDQLRALQKPGGPDLLQRVIALFRERGASQVEALQTALAQNDFETIHRSAHTLKSSAANLGASELRALCADVEASARKGVVPQSEAAKHIARAYEQALKALEELEAP